jgi:thymidylate synthase
MKQYLDLLRHVWDHGVWKGSRPRLLSTGVRPRARSVFAPPIQLRFDLNQGFPLVTTKQMPFTGIVHELIWFLSGSTNVAYLRQHKVRIWDQWADEHGELGPVYGKQWRRWEGPNGETVDQIAELLRGIEEVKRDPSAPAGRRLIVSAWNPVDVPRMKGPPACHTLSQFSVTDNRLSCHLYQRSADLFLGVPFNIASYALLTHLLARVTGLQVHEYVHTFGDAHIYENHAEQVREQLTRTPYPLPRLELDESVTSLDGLKPGQMRLLNYRCHPRLTGEVAV